jgi:phosphoenolpyruvate phosphomutase
MRTVTEFERAGAAGICIEDNEFPKRCSFYAGVRRDLVAPEEHARKVEAAVAARRSTDFAVIARTEALIAGLGLDEAMARARLYAAAGADAVLVHSKAPDFAELARFGACWTLPVPLVAVPTTYPRVSVGELASAGFRLAIFANQPLRAAIVAIRDALRRMREAGSIEAVERDIAPLDEVYRLVGVPELKANEKRFLFAGPEAPKAVILAAGTDTRTLLPDQDAPRVMLDVKGKTILERQVESLQAAGVRDVTIVRGFKKEHVAVPGARLVDNDRFRETGELYSLFQAADALGGPAVVLYGDIVFEQAVLERLLRTSADVAVVVDRALPELLRAGHAAPKRADLVVTDTPAPGRRWVAPEGGSRVLRIGPEVTPDEAHGEFIGLAAFSRAGAERLRTVHAELAAQRAEGLERASLTHLLQAMVDRGAAVVAVEIHKGWMEIDSFDDYRRAWRELRG